MTFPRDWKEEWIDRMGLIVCLSGQVRFDALNRFRYDCRCKLNLQQVKELKEALRLRFTPSNGQDGCESGMSAVTEATE